MSFLVALHLIFETTSLTEPEGHLFGQQALGILLLLPSQY